MVSLRKMERVYRDNRRAFVFTRQYRVPWHFARNFIFVKRRGWRPCHVSMHFYFMFLKKKRKKKQLEAIHPSSFINHQPVYSFSIPSLQSVDVPLVFYFPREFLNLTVSFILNHSYYHWFELWCWDKKRNKKRSN